MELLIETLAGVAFPAFIAIFLLVRLEKRMQRLELLFQALIDVVSKWERPGNG